MAIGFVQANSNSVANGGGAKTLTCTMGAAFTTGNTVVMIMSLAGSAAYGSITTTGGVTWNSVVNFTINSSNTLFLFYGVVGGAPGRTVSVAVTGAAAGQLDPLLIAEFSGVASSGALDTYNTALTSGGTTTSFSVDSSSFTNAQTIELMVAVDAAYSGGVTPTIGAPSNSFNSATTVSVSGATNQNIQLSYLITSSVAARSSATAFTSGTPVTYGGGGGILAGFFPAGTPACGIIDIASISGISSISF